MAPDDLERWREYVERRSGMAFDRRLRVLAAAVESTADIRGLSPAELFLAVDRDPAAWAALFEQLLNGETKFFRDGPGLAAFTTVALPDLRTRRADTRSLAIWSAGCSTGQEPYTLAMLCLADDGLRGWNVRVLGTDVCQSHLDRAAAGVYRGFETRTVPPAFRERFFAPRPPGDESDTDTVAAAVREIVKFERLDLTAAPARTSRPAGSSGEWTGYGLPPQDAIFCENVLIYYGPDARRRILGKLAAALAPGGYLFLGAVERIGVAPPGLDPVRLADVEIYRRPD